MNLQQLEYFLVSAQKGSLTKAAEELYTSQPHVSQVIRSLEKELDTALFHRTGSGITLTRMGEEIRFYAENTLKNASMIREMCQENQEKNLRIAVNSSSRLAFLAGDYYLLHMENGLRLTYTECGIEDMLILLSERNYDLGFLFVPYTKMSALWHRARRRNLEYTELLSSDLVIHSGPQSPFFGRKHVRPEELDQCQCIQLEDDFFSVEELLSTHPLFYSGRCHVKKAVRTNSDHLMIRMLEQTALCNIGSYWMKNRQEGENFSVSVIDGFQGQISFGYLTPAGRTPGAEAREFLYRLQQNLRLSSD